MTPKQAARIIGCSPSYVRHLVQHRKLPHVKVPTEQNQFGYYIDIPEEEIQKFVSKPRTELRGWPRGKTRTNNIIRIDF